MGRVLIVEDDLDIREDLAEVLREGGHEVITARNGMEALARLAETATPHLILLDLGMAGMDGIEFRKKQASDPALAAVPVVLLSGDIDLPQKALSMGAAGSLLKPFRLAALFDVVNQFCPVVRVP